MCNRKCRSIPIDVQRRPCVAFDKGPLVQKQALPPPKSVCRASRDAGQPSDDRTVRFPREKKCPAKPPCLQLFRNPPNPNKSTMFPRRAAISLPPPMVVINHLFNPRFVGEQLMCKSRGLRDHRHLSAMTPLRNQTKIRDMPNKITYARNCCKTTVLGRESPSSESTLSNLSSLIISVGLHSMKQQGLDSRKKIRRSVF